MPHSRRGITLAELLIAVAIIAVAAAAVAPVVMGRLDDSRAEAIVTELQALQNGIILYYQDMGRYPRDLTYLNGLPAGTKQDACGNTIPSVLVSRYRGSYISRAISLTSGRYVIGSSDDSVQSVLFRDSLATQTGGRLHMLQIFVFGPEQKIAEAVDYLVDGQVNKNAGIVHWVATTPNEYTIKWTIPVKAWAC